MELSPAMVAAGRQRPGGRSRYLRWIVGAAESCPLNGPYALATAGASLHWMDSQVVLNRLAGVLADGAMLAIVEHGPVDLPWRASLARELMSPDEAAAFGDAVYRVVAPWARAGVVEMPIVATLTWGRPTAQPIS